VSYRLVHAKIFFGGKPMAGRLLAARALPLRCAALAMHNCGAQGAPAV
jgi:hypothetical protein